ncbi:MAG: hypothetical protein ONB46_20515 [candidate division KSB1 bacterium]|nr:hypothetical protein [candidate division KSB1 bacterium]MDZ7368261.1 hypothetical protein [candidate division KSB1 bacterium]MDZ7406757.1 hypothetical protein [candidate division KSB1 bacterium]
MPERFSRTYFHAEKRFVLFVAVVAAVNLLAISAFSQTASQRLFALMSARLAKDDSIRQALSYSYDLHLTGAFYHKDDSAQVIEDWRISQTPDSIRARLVSRQINGAAELGKQYAPPLRILSVKRDPRRPEDDPVMATIQAVLQRIKKDSKSQVLIDGEAVGRGGVKNYIMRFLANDRAGSFWINAQTFALERVEWAYGKSLGLSSSGETSEMVLAPFINAINFPVKLVFNARSRTLLRRTGSYTEIEIRNFQPEDQP